MENEKEDFVEKLQGRDLINPHAIGKKVNEIIDKVNVAIAEDKNKEKENNE